VARIDETRNVYRVLIGTALEKLPLEYPGGSGRMITLKRILMTICG
jgi:hypothetical protein